MDGFIKFGWLKWGYRTRLIRQASTLRDSFEKRLLQNRDGTSAGEALQGGDVTARDKIHAPQEIGKARAAEPIKYL